MDVERLSEMAHTIGRLRLALSAMVEAFGLNVDGLPFEEGEVPVLDQARALLAQTE